jgi:hypothetical protein
VDCFNKDFDLFSDFCLRQALHITVCYKETADVETGVEIPESLLLGPWTEDQLKELFWLVKGGARINWRTSTGGEVFILTSFSLL